MFSLLFFSQCSIAESKKTKVSVVTPYLLLETFIEQTNSVPCQNIDISAADIGPSRGLVDMIVMCQALHLGGYDFELTFIPAYSYKRALRMLEQGDGDLAAETVWLNDAKKHLCLVSPPVIEDGDFIKGIFTVPDHSLRKMPDALHKLNEFSAVSRENWQNDWAKIKELTPLITNSSSYRAIFRMLTAGRADFTLMEFGQSEDFSNEIIGLKLMPVEGIKVVLPGSRHFLVSKKSANANEIAKHLAIGIEKMRESGKLKAAYANAGYYDKRIKDWVAL